MGSQRLDTTERLSNNKSTSPSRLSKENETETSEYYYYCHFSVEETEAQKSEITCPELYS